MKKELKEKLINALNYSESARLNEKKLKEKYGAGVVFIEDKETDTQCFFYMPNPYNAVFGFRGTQQMRDWLTDFDGFHTVYPYNNTGSDIQVHRGFIKAYKSVRDKIHECIKKNPSVASVHVCGHSLGGALATLCAVDLQYNFGDQMMIQCFPSGNPRVGNKAFVRSYNKRVPLTYRMYMRTDIVPCLPPRWVEKRTKGGYKHVKKNVPLGSPNPFIGFINWVRRTFKTVNVAAEITNHSIVLYRKYLMEK